MKRIAAACLIALPVLLTSGQVKAGTVLNCPNFSEIEEVGVCPGKDEILAQQKRTCLNERDPDARTSLHCDDFPSFFKNKSKSLWALPMGGEEQLTYRSCPADDSKKGNKAPVNIRIKTPDRFTWVFCTYADKETISVKIDKTCQLSNGEKTMDCGPDGTACTAVCE